ncbi:MAG: hypothetical protein JSS79_07565 [Bacteroidetes bacterium]|nr:hypothetical protein [Bacteroidota bacterium]
MSALKFCFIISLMLLGCSSRQCMDMPHLVKYLENEDNGVCKAEENNGFKVRLKYRPTDFIVQQQMQKGTQKEYDSLTRHFSNYLYFDLQITHDNKDLETYFAANQMDFAAQVSYLNADFANGIKLITAKDTTDVLDYAYLRSYGIGPSNFLLVFKAIDENNFTLEVTGYSLGFGKVSIPFTKKDIDKTPKLNLTLL